jgi:diguanylate cyclase (GGDEF)-like protein
MQPDGVDPTIDGSPVAIVAAADAAVAEVAAATAAVLAASGSGDEDAPKPIADAAASVAQVTPRQRLTESPAVQLSRRIAAMALGVIGFALVMAYITAITRDLASALVTGAAVVAAVFLYVIARRLALADRLTAAVTAADGAILGLAVVAGIAYPQAVLMVVGLPAIAVAFALPYSDRRTLLWIMVAAVAVEAFLALAGELFVPTSIVPPSVLGVLRIAGVATSAAVVVALLWQYSQRFGEALTRMAAGTVALREAEEQVGRINDELRHRVDELELRSREMSQLAKLGDLLQSCETSEEAYRVIAQTAGPLFAGDSGVLYELTENRTAVEQVAAWGENSSSGSVFAPSDCWALRRGRMYVVEDPMQDLLCAHVGDAAPAGYVCIPLTAQSETLGLLHIEIGHKVGRTRRAAHLAERMRLAITLSEHLALALAKLRLRATLRERSTRDELTGLFNRRYMEDSLDREIRRAIRDGESLGVLMLDLDHFKRLNDAFGHAAGDFALRLAGQFLQANTRGEDIACRYGGEEFVVILPKASPEDTRRRAEALRLGIRGLRAEHGGPAFPTMTVSVGVAAYPQHGATGEGLLRSADEALYRAKAEGRDRVVIASPPQRSGVTIAE